MSTDESAPTVATAVTADESALAVPAAPGTSPDKRARKRKLDVDTSLIITEGRRRRRSPSPAHDIKPDLDPRDPERAKTLGLQLLARIMAMKDSNGDEMAQPFLKLPNKRQFPDYYETIKHPLSLEQVRDKLDIAKYNQLRDVCNDLGQIWNNAKRYNMRDSTLFQWAKKLHKITRTFYNHHVSGKEESESEEEAPAPPPPRQPTTADADAADDVEDEADNATAGPSTPAEESAATPKVTGRKRGSYMKDGPTVYKLIKPCMRAIKEAKAEDGSDRDVADIFLTLPDRKEFADYYKTIKDPISLDEIEHRMVSRRYDSSDLFFADVELMCDNAMAYNEDESEVWSDAHQIRGIVAMHRELVKERLAQPKGHVPPKPRTSTTITPARPAPLPNSQAQPGVMRPPEIRSTYTQSSYNAYSTPPSHHPQLPNHSPAAPTAPTPAPYLPQLPHGVVTEEVVSSLDRYPAVEQQAWVASLPPFAQSIYRQMAAVNEARKRGVAPPAPPPMSPSKDVPLSRSPAIKHIDLTYGQSSPTSAALALSLAPTLSDEPASTRQSIRLQNLPGIMTHAVSVSQDTAKLEVTAWMDDAEAASPGSSQKDAASSDVILKVNGAPAPRPTVIYGTETHKDRPTAVRWTVNVRGLETKIEVVATRPGWLAETSAIFVNKQF